MEKVNIDGVEDEFYRYKMPEIIPKVEGKGNGIKTRIVNCSLIGKALMRPPGYVCKFFGCELGAQTMIDDKNDIYIVNGAHDKRALAELLNKFIKMFVLCEGCKLPETDIKVSKSGNIKQNCAACGYVTQVDMTHKLCTYIVNNPPDGSGKSSKKEAKGLDKSERRKKKAEKAEKGVEDAGAEEDDHEDKGEGKREKKSKKKKEDETEEEAAERRAKRKAAKKKKQGEGEEDDDDDDGVVWSTDTSKEAMAARLAEAELAASILEGRGTKSGAADSSLVSDLKKAELNGHDESGSSGGGSGDGSEEEEEDDPLVIEVKKLIDEGMKGKLVGAEALKLVKDSMESTEDQEITARAAHIIMNAYVTVEACKEMKVLLKALIPALRALQIEQNESAQMQVCNHMDRICEALEDDQGDDEDKPSFDIVSLLLKGFADNNVVSADVIKAWYERETYSDAMSSARDGAKRYMDLLEGKGDEGEDEEESE